MILIPSPSFSEPPRAFSLSSALEGWLAPTQPNNGCTTARSSSSYQSGLCSRAYIIFAAVAEERPGLRGMRALYESYDDHAFAFFGLVREGSGISYDVRGIHRWRINAYGSPEHTLNGVLPNINQCVVSLGVTASRSLNTCSTSMASKL